MTSLTQQELEQCESAFKRFDKDGSGTINIWELKSTLKEMGQNLTEEELYDMIMSVDGDANGCIDFNEFVRVIEKQKQMIRTVEGDQEIVQAFVALGGSADRTGEINTDQLRRAAADFGLTVDIEELIKQADTDESGYIDFEEFREMLRDDEDDDPLL